jgi:hypothetical protein
MTEVVRIANPPRSRRRAGALALAALALFGTLVVLAPGASAAMTCSGHILVYKWSCTGTYCAPYAVPIPNTGGLVIGCTAWD